jgi:hypothetical protein
MTVAPTFEQTFHFVPGGRLDDTTKDFDADNAAGNERSGVELIPKDRDRIQAPAHPGDIF